MFNNLWLFKYVVIFFLFYLLVLKNIVIYVVFENIIFIL